MELVPDAQKVGAHWAIVVVLGHNFDVIEQHECGQSHAETGWEVGGLTLR